VRALHAEVRAPLDETSKAESDRILRDLQGVMFAYDIGILKREDRLLSAQEQVLRLSDEFKDISAPHTHELVRLKETEAMLLAARFILGASLYRTESRLSHFREDHDQRDDGNGPAFSKTPIPTPYCSVVLPRRRPSRLLARQSVGGV
jgi:succinate dehydrogenase/fumarate reductase flavoprotein subunit